MTAQNPEKEWFGEEHVTPEEKTGKVIGVFDSVASRYDLMNDLMSGGLHRLWKDRFVRQIRPRAGLRYLDVAGGTGDIAFRIRKKLDLQYKNPPLPPGERVGVRGQNTNAQRLHNTQHPHPNPPPQGGGDIVVCDLNEHMLEVGRSRAENKGWLDGFDWVTSNAESLPFPDASFDVYSIAFGLRNVTHIDTALKEVVRVLKPGGRFYCLEFSHVRNPALSKAYDLFSFKAIPRIGKIVAQDSESYQYLVESIRKFPSQQNLLKRMDEAGLKKCSFSNISSGIVAIHSGIKV